MGQIDGKTALILLVEEQHGFQKFSDRYYKYLRARAKQFYQYLCRVRGQLEAKEIIERIIESTRFELEHEWQDAFIISPQREDSHTEIDIFNTEKTDPKILLQQEFNEVRRELAEAEAAWEQRVAEA